MKRRRRFICIKTIMAFALRIFQAVGDFIRNKGIYDCTEQNGQPQIRQQQQLHISQQETNEGDEIGWLYWIIVIEKRSLQHLFYSQLSASLTNSEVKVFFKNPVITDWNIARFRSSPGKHADNWLTAIPKDVLWMTSKEFRVAAKLRLGINMQ